MLRRCGPLVRIPGLASDLHHQDPNKTIFENRATKTCIFTGAAATLQPAMSTAVYAVHAAQWAARQGASAPRREFFSQLR